MDIEDNDMVAEYSKGNGHSPQNISSRWRGGRAGEPVGEHGAVVARQGGRCQLVRGLGAVVSLAQPLQHVQATAQPRRQLSKQSKKG